MGLFYVVLSSFLVCDCDAVLWLTEASVGHPFLDKLESIFTTYTKPTELVAVNSDRYVVGCITVACNMHSFATRSEDKLTEDMHGVYSQSVFMVRISFMMYGVEVISPSLLVFLRNQS